MTIHSESRPGPEPREPLAVGRKEAAAMLGISERLLWTWTNAKTIPHVRIGTRVLYPVDELRR
jgi:excisionase family DNA binding protein